MKLVLSKLYTKVNVLYLDSPGGVPACSQVPYSLFAAHGHAILKDKASIKTGRTVPRHEKTGLSPVRKQRRRSASQ